MGCDKVNWQVSKSQKPFKCIIKSGVVNLEHRQTISVASLNGNRNSCRPRGDIVKALLIPRPQARMKQSIGGCICYKCSPSLAQWIRVEPSPGKNVTYGTTSLPPSASVGCDLHWFKLIHCVEFPKSHSLSFLSQQSCGYLLDSVQIPHWCQWDFGNRHTHWVAALGYGILWIIITRFSFALVLPQNVMPPPPHNIIDSS